jgi:hypothetical protein
MAVETDETLEIPAADQAAEEQGEAVAADAITELQQIGPDGSDDRQKPTLDEAVEAGDVLADALENRVPVFGGSRAQDHLNYELSRREEAAGQGAVKTLQEAQWELDRTAEAQAQGVETIADTTQKALFTVSRQEEVRAEKLEELHGPSEPVSIAIRSFAMQPRILPGDAPPEREQPAEESEFEQQLKAGREGGSHSR